MNRPILLSIAFFALVCPVTTRAQPTWKPADGLKTKWGKQIDPEGVWPEYPRPQLVRDQWLNLNGLWDFAATEQASFDRKILVPFPVESALSGIKMPVPENSTVRYKRTFLIPEKWVGQRVLLHFGAVDWMSTVRVNGKPVGTHTGGYDAFTYDITDQLHHTGQQTVEVDVKDPSDSGLQPRGKQSLKPESIFYTASTGIWQTVWLEPVPQNYIRSIQITPDIDKSQVHIKIYTPTPTRVRVMAETDEFMVAAENGESAKDIVLNIPNVKLWSPQSAFLYRLSVHLLDNGSITDKVESYFGMRKISLGQDHGVTRIFLNNKPQFMLGTLDQGFWPDGLYSPPSDEAMKSDLDMLKKLGFNTVRKHVKVEPERWYYWCDKMGLLVWQDMPSGDRSIGPNDGDIQRTPESAQDFETELKAMIDGHRSHPSIVMWVLFNEGWGQYDTARLAHRVKELDPTRLLDSVTGWADRGVGDVIDMHSYPGPDSPKPEPTRAAVLGEFGGLGLPTPGHLWADKGWGYKEYKTPAELSQALVSLLQQLRALQSRPGLSAAIYTQTTDVETELNGLLTYDREVLKPDLAAVKAAIQPLYLPPPTIVTVMPTAIDEATSWKYTTYQPLNEWTQLTYKDAQWAAGQGGFGTQGTPGAKIRTAWDRSDLWLRKSFDVPKGMEWHSPNLLIHHDDGADVYIDGQQVASLSGYTTSYTYVKFKTQKPLAPGKHMLAIHCHQVSGGQYIDCGIVDVKE
jgi:beta-galactosidase/beta-glucuronidase